MKRMISAAAFLTATLLTLILLNGCQGPVRESGGLAESMEGQFLLGATLSKSFLQDPPPAEQAIVLREFNAISPENSLKFERLHPEENRYTFELSDRFVDFGETNGMEVHGHTLVWHNQIPDWVFVDENGGSASRALLLERMRNHIHTVMGRYKGRIATWDVVNEAVASDGELRMTPWLEIIGEDYIEQAFQFAREADPGAILLYNDFSMWRDDKRSRIIQLAESLKEKGLIDGIGLQGHWQLDNPDAEKLRQMLHKLAATGLKLYVTELDINVLPSKWSNVGADVSKSFKKEKDLDPYTNGLPDAMQERLSQRYAGIFNIFSEHHALLEKVTFWGITDRTSWLNDFPVKGRTNHPLLFDRDGKPKPAYGAVLKAVQ